ncbi:tryptophan synthase subunit alpha [Kallotenue papyrolyticum]|uniref:tryptophan synthase subunit alpha n=1 Tax=Kallotenue papyrolyticum TaxID=1325125 RepID=UPI0004785D70|nr:tryptophan synthase subunit alpha [Kallotenue papyrolyticum]
MTRIATTWERLRAAGRRALILYLTVGFPERDSALELVPRLLAAGADMIELGVPFSDPLAEGPTIQAATQRALANGITVRACIETVRTLRAQGIAAPLLLMGYLNPMLRYGVERFCQDAQAAGVDGLIFPDLPPEESGELQAACDRHGLDLIQFVAPTSTPERIAHVTEHASGFIYCVSVTGVTGARATLPPDLPDFLARVRRRTQTPLAVGFGISRPEHARNVAAIADGVIVGSALIDQIARGGDVEGFVRELRAAIDDVTTPPPA